MQARIDAPILVTGGTGTLGSLVAMRLHDGGYAVRVLSRGHRRRQSPGIEYVAGDLANGQGIAAAFDGVRVVVHCAGSQSGDDVKARHLVGAAARAGVRHLLFISVVGADRIPMASAIDRAMFGYFGAKLAAERIVAGSGIPWTTLRATQFHQLIFTTLEQMSKLPVIPVPAGVRFQPIDAAEVAARLAELAAGDPAGLMPEIAGPHVYDMADLVRTYLKATHRSRPLISMPMLGRAAAAFRAGANLAPDRAVGRTTWEEFLAVRLRLERVPNATAP